MPGGKFLRLTAKPSGEVCLTGDFFIHPEEGIEELEKILSSLPDSMEVDEVEAAITKGMKSKGIEAVGFSPFDLAAMLAEARR